MGLLKLRSRGRGKGYSPIRGLVESFLGIAYAARWPAVLLDRFRLAPTVKVISCTFPIRETGREPIRVGFISDLHIGPTTPNSTLDDAFGQMNEASVDVLLLGGDYVFLDATRQKLSSLRLRLGGLRAKHKVAILGNHDLWTQHELIEDVLAESGFRILTNNALPLPSPHDDVVIVGLDEPWIGQPDAAQAFSSVPPGSTVIVICHGPSGLNLLQDLRWDLYLCGHTHGGHISTRWGTPVAAGGELSRLYSSGFHQVRGGCVFVSRGVGGIEVPIRVGAHPDIGVFEITSRVTFGDDSIRAS